MVKICRTGLLKINFEIIPKKRIFRVLPKISANPWTLRVSGMGGYTSKCEKKSKSLHPTPHPSNTQQHTRTPNNRQQHTTTVHNSTRVHKITNVPLFKKLWDIIFFCGTITLWAISRDILRGPRLFWPKGSKKSWPPQNVPRNGS
jgi:hypothetical protein